MTTDPNAAQEQFPLPPEGDEALDEGAETGPEPVASVAPLELIPEAEESEEDDLQQIIAGLGDAAAEDLERSGRAVPVSPSVVEAGQEAAEQPEAIAEETVGETAGVDVSPEEPAVPGENELPVPDEAVAAAGEAKHELVPEPEPVLASEPDPGTASARVSVWPFVAYEALWVAYAAILAWQLTLLPEGVATYDSALYRPALYIGVALTALGPIVSLVTWLVTRHNADVRRGLFASALLYGALATLLGVVLWWTALIGADYLRLGSLL